MDRFHYPSMGLAIILAFIAIKLVLQASHKMISTSIPEIPSPISLVVIVAILTVSIVLSIRRPPPNTYTGESAGGTESRKNPSGGKPAK